MRLQTVRWCGRVSLSVLMLAALWCSPAAAQGVRESGRFPQRSATVQPGPSTDVAEGSPGSSPQTPVSNPDADSSALSTGQPRTAMTLLDTKQPSTEATISTGEAPLKPVPDPIVSGVVQIEAASFKGVTPDVTTMAEVEKAWGAPKEIQKQGNLLMGLYSVEPFKRVEVSYYQDKVSSVVIRFAESFPANTVAEQLELINIRAVLVSNELGEVLGQVYPERGVLFAFEPSESPGKTARKVVQVILEPINAEPFLLRAESNLGSRYDLSLKDLEQALKLQPGSARAHWLHSRVLVAMGDYEKAAAASAQAVRLDPADTRYGVTRAQILGQVGQLTDAIRQAQKAADTSGHRPHVKARALCLLGDLVASGLKPDYRRAIQYHIEAVKTADTLATSRHPAVRVAAKEVLVDAHLGAAHDIAWGDWKEKEEAVTKWLTRADAFAEDLVENEGGSREHRFRVNARALAACVGVRGGLDPGKWTQGAIRTGESLIAATDDPARKAQLQWDLGMALYDALQVYQMRNQHDTALKYGEWAIEYLEKGDQRRQSTTSSYLLGRLYFRLGAIHAIRDKNHGVAITWFEKAVPLLEKPIPKEAFADLGRHGETFVSMGVSFWESGQREKAVELTERGVELMQKAVKQGTLDESALTVPYGNLASMHRQLGRDDDAKRFEELATRNKGTTLK